MCGPCYQKVRKVKKLKVRFGKEKNGLKFEIPKLHPGRDFSLAEWREIELLKTIPWIEDADLNIIVR